MNAFHEFKDSLRLSVNTKMLYIQLIPAALIFIQAFYAPIIINPVLGAYHGVTSGGLNIIYILSITLFIINCLILIIHNLFIKNNKFSLKEAPKYLVKIIIGGLIINAFYFLGYYTYMLPAVIVIALFLFYNQAVIINNKGMLSSLKESIIIFKNNLRTTLNLLTLIFGLSMINWIPFGVIANCFLQPGINLTIAKIYKEKFIKD